MNTILQKRIEETEKEYYEKAMQEAYEEEYARQEYEMQMMFEGGEK